MKQYTLYTFIVIIILFIASTQCGNLVTCWDCSSIQQGNDMCGDPFQNETGPGVQQVDCAPNEVCYKQAIKRKGRRAFVRKCLFLDGNLELCTTYSEGDAKTTSCYCSTDLCNGGEKTTINIMSLFRLVGIIGLGEFIFMN